MLPNPLPLKYKNMAEKQDIKMNQFQVVTDAPYIYVELADGSQGKIKKSDLAEVIRAAMPIATQTMNGLMSANNIIYKGNVGQDNLENVGSSFGYAYGDGDGSGISGLICSKRAGRYIKENQSRTCQAGSHGDEAWTKTRCSEFPL